MNRLLRNITTFAMLTFLLGDGAHASSKTGDVTLMEFLATRLAKQPIRLGTKDAKALSLDDVCSVKTDAFSRRVFAEYGAVFAADSRVVFPWKCVFESINEVEDFQKSLKTKSVQVDGVAINLQEAAMDALAKAANEASTENLRIIPFDGAIAGRRSYYDSVALWSSRFFPALDHWVRTGAISEADATTARSIPIRAQVEKVMQWESAGYLFGTARARSIFSSTAPPGSSQHLSMLAFDVRNYSDPRIRQILASNGWFQTVVNDPTHFTFLGVSESELPSRGLVKVDRGTFVFWVPRL